MTKSRREADGRRLAAQQPRAQRMERRDPHAAAVGAEERFDARAHFLCRLVRERDGENLPAAWHGRRRRGNAMRLVMTRVLPEPAPARISSGPLMCRTASRCSGLRDSRNCIGARDSRLGTRTIQLTIVLRTHPEPRAPSPGLFDRDALRQIPRLVDVAAAAHGDVVGQQLQRNDHHDRREQLGRPGHLDDAVACSRRGSRRACRRRASSAR